MPKNNSAARRAERRTDAEKRFASSKHVKTGRKANLLFQELPSDTYGYTPDGTPLRLAPNIILAQRQLISGARSADTYDYYNL